VTDVKDTRTLTPEGTLQGVERRDRRGDPHGAAARHAVRIETGRSLPKTGVFLTQSENSLGSCPSSSSAIFADECPLCAAMCGRLRVGKRNFHVAGRGRCSHVLMRFT
jgi:hypothetical protein